MSRLFVVLPLVATVDHDIFLFKVQLPERTAVLHSSYASGLHQCFGMHAYSPRLTLKSMCLLCAENGKAVMDHTSTSGQENGAPSEQAPSNYGESSYPSSWPPHSAHGKPQPVRQSCSASVCSIDLLFEELSNSWAH